MAMQDVNNVKKKRLIPIVTHNKSSSKHQFFFDGIWTFLVGLIKIINESIQ